MPDSVAKRRIGVLGGTFDPPHFGHLTAAVQVADLLSLEQVWFVPTGDSWQKSEVTPVGHRVEMVRLAIQGNPRLRLDTIDVEREGPTYTVDTLRGLRAAHPDCEFFFIMGVDAASTLDSWREFEALPSLAELVVVNRPGVAIELVHQLRAKSFFTQLRILEIDGVEVSSTEVRARISRGESIENLVPQTVSSYISEYSLYRSSEAENLSEQMSDQLPFKSRREMREAERAGLIEPQELPFDATPRVGDAAPVPVESTGEPLTRRQLRELEKTGGILAVHTSQVELPNLPPEPQSWAPEPEAEAGTGGSSDDMPVAAISAYEPVLAEREEPMTAANPIWASEPEVQAAVVAVSAQTAQVDEPVAEEPMAPVLAPEESAADRDAVLQAAREFDALFDRIGEEQKPARSVKRILIWVTAVLAVVVGGLLIAANALGILK
jgi:nicotinate-nucleotide adenylyltransferase